MERLNILHPILMAAYVEWGVRSSYEDAIKIIRLFARQVLMLDEFVEYWAYLCRSIDGETLEALLKEARDRAVDSDHTIPGESVSPRLFSEANLEHFVLEWLLACLRESYEDERIGGHLLRLGLVPEPYWRVTGLFDEEVPIDIEQGILGTVFENSKSVSQELDWLTPDDPLDGYIDCRRMFQTMDRVSAYAQATLISPVEQRVTFSLYHDDSACVWINGQQQFQGDDVDFSMFHGILKPGQNRILIRLTNYEEGWGFMLRVLDSNNRPLTGLQ